MKRNLSFGNSVPSREMLLKQLPENIFGNTAPGCGCYNGPRCLVPATFSGLTEYDGGGAPPVAVQHA